MSFGTINPVTMNVPQVAYTNKPIELPDIVGLYQASRTQSLENQKAQAEIEYRRAQAQAEQADVGQKEALTRKTEQEIQMGLAEPGLKQIQNSLDRGDFDNAQLQTDYFRQIFPELSKSYLGVPYINKQGIELTPMVGPDEKVYYEKRNAKTKELLGTEQTDGITPAMSVARANREAQQAIYNTEQSQKQTEKEKEEARYKVAAINDARDRFTNTIVYKSAADSMVPIDAIGTLAAQALGGNPAAPEQLRLAIAKIAQSGILTDKDVERVLPDPSLVGRLSTAVNILSSGKYSASDIKNYTNLAKAMKRDLYVGLSKKRNEWADETVAQLTAGKYNVSKDELKSQTSSVLSNIFGDYTPPKPPTATKPGVPAQSGFSNAAINALRNKVGSQ